MAVSDGENVNALVTNAAFISRTINSNTIGKINLENSDSNSVIDLQQTINRLTPQVVAVETIAGAVISSDNNDKYQIRRVVSSSGQQTLDFALFGVTGGWDDGVVIELIGTSDINTLIARTDDSDSTQYGAILNGDIELRKYQRLILRYDSSFERWIEVGRN